MSYLFLLLNSLLNLIVTFLIVSVKFKHLFDEGDVSNKDLYKYIKQLCGANKCEKLIWQSIFNLTFYI